jgi:hypothetical protein
MRPSENVWRITTLCKHKYISCMHLKHGTKSKFVEFFDKKMPHEMKNYKIILLYFYTMLKWNNWQRNTRECFISWWNEIYN